jgi:uncharacterized protein (DUF58 family)
MLCPPLRRRRRVSSMIRVMKRSTVPFLRRLFSGMSCRRSIRLTSEGIRFLLFAAAVGIAAVNTGNNLFYLLLAMMLSLILVSGLLSELSLRRLTFRRRVPDYVFANEPAGISLMVSNQKTRFPSFSLRLYDIVDGTQIDEGTSIPFLAPRTSRTVIHTFLAARRGLCRLDGLRIATCFPFGLVQRTVSHPDDAIILVCPTLAPLSLPILQQLAAIGHDQELGRRGPGMALYNLREYRPGDDSRAIHWMTTARTSKLMLKETEADDQRIVTIMLSLFAPADEDDAAFERAVSVAASLTSYFHDCSYSISAVIGDETIGPGTGAEHYVQILRALALCRRHKEESLDQTESVPVKGRGAEASAPNRHLWGGLLPLDAGMVIGVTAAPADHEGMHRLASADCLITTSQSGEPVYVTRTGLRS